MVTTSLFFRIGAPVILAIGLTAGVVARKSEAATPVAGSWQAPQLVYGKDMTLAQLQQGLAKEGSALGIFTKEMRSMVINAQRNHEVEALVDRKAILASATSVPAVDRAGAAVRDLFVDSTMQTWEKKGVLVDYYGSNFRFLRPLELKGRAGLLFRSTTDAGELNYVMFTLRQLGAKEFRITDIMTVGLNAYMSETLNRTYGRVAAAFNPPGVTQEMPELAAYAEHMQEVAQIGRELAAGSYDLVLEHAATLPAVLRRERSVLLVQMEAADKLGTAQREDIYQEWLSLYPDEQELPLKLADYYLSKHQWDDAERVLTGLQARIGEDFRLLLQLGEIQVQREKGKPQSVAAAAAVGVDGEEIRPAVVQ